MSAVAKEKAPTLAVIRGNLKNLGSAIVELYGEAGRLRVRIGVALAEADALIVAFPKAYAGTWKEWVEATLPELDLSSNVSADYQSLNRMLRAGRVARVIGDDIGDASENTLTELHRFVNGSEEGDEKVREVWSAASKLAKAGRTVTLANVKEAIAKLYPDAKGSAGPDKGSAKPKGSGRKAKAPAKDSEPSGDDGDISPTAMKAATQRIGRITGESVKLYGDSAAVPTHLVIRATIQACVDIGALPMLRAIETLDAEAKLEAAAKKAASGTAKVTRTRKATAKAA